MPKLFCVALVAMIAAGCGGGFQDELRHRAAVDLSCPAGSVTLTSVGAGGWHASGCSNRARYVCVRRTCSLEGPIEQNGVGDQASVSLAPYACQAMGATASDVTEIERTLSGRVPTIAGCGATGFAVGISRGRQQVDLLSVDGDRACVSAALNALAVSSQSGVVLRCDAAPR